MARLIIPERVTNSETPIDATFPMTCNIESSYVIDGHGEYSIRITRLNNDPLSSWIIKKRFREFVELNNKLKEYGYNFDLPKKKFLGNTDRTFLSVRQKGLQTYLNTLVQYFELCNSLTVHHFLDPKNHLINYPESALQYVSMFIRSMNNLYEIIEPLSDFGFRYNKSYFLVSKSGRPKDERYLLIWCHYGLDKTLCEKDVLNCLKFFKTISHPFIAPIDEVYANEYGILTIYRYFNRGSLKDYIHQTKPNQGVYWKRYGPTSTIKQFEINQIKYYGRQILEALYFLYDNNLFYGHLHLGNILFDIEQTQIIQLVDLVNTIAGVSSKYRYYLTNLKQIHTMEQSDVYGFGRLLYELSTGEECPMTICTEFPSIIPIEIQKILSKIFILSDNFPTIQQLLNEPFFQIEIFNNIERLHMKFNNKLKESFEQISRTVQQHLENDRIEIKCAQRHLQISNHLMSNEEKLRRRRERQAKALEKQMESSFSSTDTSKSIQQSINVDPLQIITETTTINTFLSPNSSFGGTPEMTQSTTSSSNSIIQNDRTDLLTSIANFNISNLKNTKTNDRSAPQLN